MGCGPIYLIRSNRRRIALTRRQKINEGDCPLPGASQARFLGAIGGGV